MASQWYHGRTETFWFGMPPVLTPMLLTTMGAGAVTSLAVDLKKVKYCYLEGHPYCLQSNRSTWSSFPGAPQRATVDHRLPATTSDTKSYSYLLQCLSVAVQRGNAASLIYNLVTCRGFCFRVYDYIVYVINLN